MRVIIISALWMVSITSSTSIGEHCPATPQNYTAGVVDEVRCPMSKFQSWCASSQQCVTGDTCPVCNYDTAKHACSGPNGMLCCDYQCDPGDCTDPIALDFGVEDETNSTMQCLNGQLWCASLEDCIDAMAVCPFCPEHAPFYCGPKTGTTYEDYIQKGKCCNYNDASKCMAQPDFPLATVETCSLLMYNTQSCRCGTACWSYTREYISDSCAKCNGSVIRTGSFGQEPCSMNDYWAKDLEKSYDLLVLPCAIGEFAFLDAAPSLGVQFMTVAIGIFYAFVY